MGDHPSDPTPPPEGPAEPPSSTAGGAPAHMPPSYAPSAPAGAAPRGTTPPGPARAARVGRTGGAERTGGPGRDGHPHGFRHPARTGRRGPAGALRRRLPRRRTMAVVFTVTLASGVIFGLSASTQRDTTASAGGEGDLITLVRRQQAVVADLDSDTQALQSGVDAELAAGSPSPTPSPTSLPQLATVPVQGPGVTVTLTDAPPGPVPDGASVDDLVIHQQDIEDVMNALWQGGAEAMTVQKVRITSRSVIRCIGNVILVDGTAYSPPYVISAIGDPDRLRTTVNADRRVVNYKAYVALYGLGWEMEAQDRLAFDAAPQDLQTGFAQVVEDHG